MTIWKGRLWELLISSVGFMAGDVFSIRYYLFSCSINTPPFTKANLGLYPVSVFSDGGNGMSVGIFELPFITSRLTTVRFLIILKCSLPFSQKPLSLYQELTVHSRKTLFLFIRFVIPVVFIINYIAVYVLSKTTIRW